MLKVYRQFSEKVTQKFHIIMLSAVYNTENKNQLVLQQWLFSDGNYLDYLKQTVESWDMEHWCVKFMQSSDLALSLQ